MLVYLVAVAGAGVGLGEQALVEAVVYTRLGPGANWEIYLVDDGAPRRLTDDAALDYNAVFSPDGAWIVFTSERDGNAELYALRPDDSARLVRLTESGSMDDAASFSPDGSRIVFVSTRDGDADIFAMPFLPDAPVQARAVNLTRRPGGDFNPVFSPDGRSIAFSRQPRLRDEAGLLSEDIELSIMDADGSNLRPLPVNRDEIPSRIDGSRIVSGAPAWSPDGEFLYYYHWYEYSWISAAGVEESRRSQAEIRRIHRNGGTDRRVVVNGYSPAVMPDGRVAFLRPADGDEPPRHLTGILHSVADSGAGLRPEAPGLDGCFAPDYDRHSRHMVCHGPAASDESVDTLDRPLALPGGTRRVELPDRMLTVRAIRGYFPALTPNGEVLFSPRISSYANTRAGGYTGMSVSLLLAPIDGIGARPVFTPQQGVAWGAFVAGDAGWAVAAVGPTFGFADSRADIWRFDLDGANAVNLTADSPGNDALPSASDDGRHIVFRSSRDGLRAGPDDVDLPVNMAIYLMSGDGQDAHRLTDSDVRETMPAISPDGELVVYVAHEGNAAKLWLRRVDGTEARLLEPERANLPDLSLHPRFSPDGRWVVFTSDRGGFNDEWPLTRAPQPYGDLWAIPVAGGDAVRLTDNKWEDGPNDWGYLRSPGVRGAPPRRGSTRLPPKGTDAAGAR